ARLLPAMMPAVDLPRALLRGRYMAAVARMEWTGVPIDVEAYTRLRDGWGGVKAGLIDALDPDGEGYVPTRRALHPPAKAGAAVLEAAAADRVPPSRLAAAVDSLWDMDRATVGDTAAAVRAARRDTGLTVRRIGRWEDAGRDYST